MSMDKNKNNRRNDNIEVNYSKSTLSSVDREFERSLSAHKPAEMPAGLYGSILNETVNRDIAVQHNNSTTVKLVPVPLWKQYARAAAIGIVCGSVGVLAGRMSVDTQETAPGLTTLAGATDNNDYYSYFDDTNTSTANTDYLISNNLVYRQPYSRAAYRNASYEDNLEEQLDRSTFALRTSLNKSYNNNEKNNTVNITPKIRRDIFFGNNNAVRNLTR